MKDMKDEAILRSVELLWAAAQNKKGRGFTPTQISHITHYLNSLSTLLMQREKQVVDLEKRIQDGIVDIP